MMAGTPVGRKCRRYDLAMASVGLGARVLLALVFTVAAVGKLADEPGTRAALRGFRVPRRAVIPVRRALPFAELLTAAALLIQPSARWGAAAALVLLGAFVAAIAAAMVRGEAPDCHCFGQLHSAPAGRVTLIRNGLLAVPAVFVLAQGPGTSLDSWLSSRSAADALTLVAAVTLAALAALVWQLRLENRRLSRDLKRVRDATAQFPPGPPRGAPAPRFSLPDVHGNTVNLEGLLALGRPLAIVFISPDCGPCTLLFPSLAGWQRTLADRMTIAIAGQGSARELQALAQTHGLRNVLVDPEGEVFAAYRAHGTPAALIVTPEGGVGSSMHATAPIVEALLRRALADTVAGDPSGPVQNGDTGALHPNGIEVVQWAAPARN